MKLETTKGKMLISESIQQFDKHMKNGMAHVNEACRIYADAIMSDYTAVYEFQAAFPYITDSTWDKIRLVGIGSLNAKVLLLSDRMASKIMRLPHDEQTSVLIDKIEVYKEKKVVKKDITDLKPEEWAYVFDDDMKKRTVEAQKKIKESKKNDKYKKCVPYYINGKTLVVNRKCVLSLKELKLLVQKMS